MQSKTNIGQSKVVTLTFERIRNTHTQTCCDSSRVLNVNESKAASETGIQVFLGLEDITCCFEVNSKQTFTNRHTD